jgi:3-oxoacyl-[acyl-carrier-protein] synthase II
MKRRVVVTGLGAITPIGNSVDEFWDSIKNAKIGFAPISYFDVSEYKCHMAAQIKDFDAERYMDKKAARRMELFGQYAVAAAKQAIEDSGLDMDCEDPYRVGCSIGNGVGSLQTVQREYTRLLERGASKVSPMCVPLMITNMASGNVSIMFGLKGKNINVVTACATGTNSVGEAFRTIQCGDADVMVCGGSEASIVEIGVAGFTALNALSTNDDPERCSIPFDKDRNGFVMGEGAGIVILEDLEHALNRGAKIYAEVLGYGCSSDAYHITSPLEDGEGAARAMTNAMDDAGLLPEQITYINAHGTGTYYNDLFETRAIKKAFGDHAKDLRINSTKSMVGHMLGAAGAVEFITCVKEVNEDYIHKTAGLNECDEEMDLNYCRQSYNEEVPFALSNSLGFGGHNASILIGKYRD